MTAFFKGIVDYKKAAQWLSKYASAYTGLNLMNYDNK